MKYFSIALAITLIKYARGAEICCGNAGCFNDSPPFNFMPLPDCPSSMNPLAYTMYTRTNRNDGEIVSDSVVPGVYVPSRRTAFLAHGWNGNGNSSWLHNMKNALLDREDINVVIVNWGGGAEVINYNKAASNTRAAGAQTSLVIQRLLQVAGSASSRMWCVGHSLGSHVCGHAGMRQPSNIPLGRVTGLDPAGPLFEQHSDKTIGLNPTSATFVDILHTDSRGLDSLGTLRDLGHIDFYPQGGSGMPGCFLKQQFSNRAPESWDDEIVQPRDSCSHNRVTQFMIESVKKDCFHTTHMCENYNQMPGSCTPCSCGNFPCGYMGYAAESSCQRYGLHYLTVTASVPYCAN